METICVSPVVLPLPQRKPRLRIAAEENGEGPMMQKSQKTRDESIGGTKTIYRSGADSIVRGDVSELSYILDNVLINVY